MKIAIPAEARRPLVSAVSRLAALCPARPTIPAQGMIALHLDGPRLRLAADNGQQALQLDLSLPESAETLACLVPGRLLAQFLASLPAGALSLEISDAAVTLRAGRARMTLPRAAAETACGATRDIEVQELAPHCQIPAAALSEALSAVARSAASHDDRAVLTGVHLALTAQAVNAVATDGRRLSIYQAHEEAPSHSPTLPSAAVSILDKLLGGSDLVSIHATPSRVTLSGPGWRFSTLLLEGAYPNYSLVIPLAGPADLIAQLSPAETQDLRDAIARVSLAAAHENASLRLRLAPGELTLETSSDGSQGSETIPAASLSIEAELSVNPQYLLECLPLSGQATTLRIRDKVSPIAITQGRLLSILMPMRSA